MSAVRARHRSRPSTCSRRRRPACVALALGAILLGAPEAGARDLEIELGGFAGAHFFSAASPLGRLPGAVEPSALAHAAAFGVRGGVALHPRVTLEAELLVAPTRTADAQAQVLVFGWRAHGLVHVLTGRLRPFALVGGGALTASSANPALVQLDTQGALHGGVGAKLDIRRDWGLRLEGRILLLPPFEAGLLTQDYEVLLGLYGRFGGKGRERVPADKDRDGIPDAQDRCPDAAEDRDGFQDDDGCPDPDNDGDGVADTLDRCPLVAGPEENQGCPDQDGDRDGVPDRLDRCPNQLETRNGYQDGDGCPDEVPEALARLIGPVEGIAFHGGQALLTAASFAALDRIARVLNEHPGAAVEIAVRAEEGADPQRGAALARERAEMVREALIDRGVEAERIQATGRGPEAPGALARAAGRSRSRPVELYLATPR